MALPATKQPANPASTSGPKTRRLKKGELLFSEGEGSKAMYLLRSGMIRVFKKKGDSPIELDTIRSGQIIGELAFLDGNPRSASAEAMSECELMEISGTAFQEIITKLPDWLKILLKTVVLRLRTASTRIRQLEATSTALTYNDRDGKRTAQYIFLMPIEVMKICTSILLVASRNGKKSDTGLEFSPALLTRYANQIMGVPAAKITTMLDIFAQLHLVDNKIDDDSRAVLKDIDFLEKLIAYLNEENLTEAGKRHDLSPRGFVVMNLMIKHLAKYPKDEKSDTVTLNVAEIRATETPEGGKEPFRLEDLEELVKLGYVTAVNLKSNTEVFTTVSPELFTLAYRVQKVVLCVQAVNEQKSKTGARG